MNDPEREKWLHDEAMSIRLRDQFACAALTGVLANTLSRGTIDEIAMECYAWAEGMLKAREVQP